MFQLVAWGENLDPGAADTNLAGIVDDSVDVNGDLVRVPAGMANLLGEFAQIEAATPAYARIESPSLRQLANQYIEPFVTADGADHNLALSWHPFNPRPLVAGENLEAVINATGGVGADNWVGAWFGEGAIQPVQGNIFTLRATAAIAQSNFAWVSGNLTFAETLPFGQYQVVGMRCHAASGTLARLIFIGSGFRPGVPVVTAATGLNDERFRFGRAGVWGAFDLNQPPKLEVLGGAATAQVVLLDLIKSS